MLGFPELRLVPLAKQISDDGTLIIFPRFDESWAGIMGYKAGYRPRRIDPMLDEGLYEYAWQTAVELRDEVSLLMVYSWNEHGDHSAIEPTKGVTHLSAGGTLINKTRRYYEQFLAGQPIAPCPGGVTNDTGRWAGPVRSGGVNRPVPSGDSP